MKNIIALIMGMAFGIILVKAEVLSWFRIQEMFAFQSIHMYGIIGSAVIVGAISVWIIKKMKARSIEGNVIEIPEKAKLFVSPYVGGTIFGLGWAMTGACPGPLYALIGSGITIMVLSVVMGILGVLTYAKLRDKLPH